VEVIFSFPSSISQDFNSMSEGFAKGDSGRLSVEKGEHVDETEEETD
jgi:hypothetical protein